MKSRYSELRPTFVIFFCPFPLFHGEQCVYRFPRICANHPSLTLPDESELIFITSKGKRDGLSASMCALLDYMEGKVSTDPLVERIEERIHFVKQQEQEERDYMIFEMRLRDERAEARAEGRAEGKAEGKAEAARSLMESLGITKEKAMELLRIPTELQPKVLALL